jgi:hypothetical protein
MQRPLPVLAATILLVSAGCNEFEITTLQVAELFQQSPYEKVDVLLVVDNSGSMQPYQEKLARDFGGFFDYFDDAEVDWELAVTHTDSMAEDFGRIRGPIVTPAAPDPDALFTEVVNVGAEGGGIEAGLAGAALLLERAKDGFPRPDSSISVIFVSDEQDASPQSVHVYANRFFELRGQRQRQAFNASALTVTELDACTPEQFAASSSGTRYVETARLTGGISANLCEDDFTQIVLDLALTTSSLLDTFYLRAKPALDSLTLLVDGVPVPCTDGSWRYDLVEREGALVPAILFELDRIPAPGAEVLVEYVQGQGDPADFCQQETP